MPLIENDKIPGPAPHVMFGNGPDLLPDIVGNVPKLHQQYGPVLKLSLDGHTVISTWDPDGLHQALSEDDCFTKNMISVYNDLALLNGRGLVTTATSDRDWIVAHKLLMPAFSGRAMKAYHDSMGRLIQDLLGIMDAYQASGEPFDVGRWMISLALQSIATIGFDFDFGLLKDPNAPRHPFSVALAYVQSMVMKRAASPSWLKWWETGTSLRFYRDLASIRTTIDDVLTERRAHPHGDGDEKDLLDFMMSAKTKEGERLDDALIRDNIITMLSAGHNTTSSLLSWTILELARNPEVAKNIVQELVDVGIVPGEIPAPELVNKCHYLDAVIKESLRIHSPIVAIPRYCKKDCTLNVQGNEYEVKAGQYVQVQLSALHRNPAYWENPDVFDPERFTDPDVNAQRHPNAWMPFNDGPRACIGRSFAMQEGKLALIMMLLKYQFVMDDPTQHINYTIIISLKPVNFFVRVKPAVLPERSVPDSQGRRVSIAAPTQPAASPATPVKVPLPKATFLYGTQTGMSEEYARKLSVQAKEFGIDNVTVAELDDWAALKGEKVGGVDPSKASPDGDIQVAELVVIVTSTYNGYPPSNAIEFEKWIRGKTQNVEATKANEFEGCLYAVFGCGNKQWASTFQKFPRKIDEGMDLLGAERLLPPGAGDANEDIDGDFSLWSSEFWSALMQRFGQETGGKNADIMTANAPLTNPGNEFTLTFLSQVSNKDAVAQAANNKHQHGVFGEVTVNRELQVVEKSHRSTRHIEVVFPPAEDGKPLYDAGDHLEVTPVNDAHIVEEIALNLGLALDSVFEITDLQISSLSPRSMAANIKGPCTIRNALTYYADISSPPTRYTLSALGKQLAKVRPDVAERLQAALQPGKETPALKEFLATHRTFYDIMRAMHIKELDWKEFIATVNCIVPRKYSISSGPSEHPNDVSISVGIVRDLGGEDGKQVYDGLCSGFLSRQAPGTKINAQIKACKSTFRLPEDPTKPVVFICAGTGFSPFRGFLQERHAQGQRSIASGGASDAYLFFGCRSAEYDFIYKDEIDGYLADGTLTTLFNACSREKTKRYVQHLLLQQAQLLFDLVENKGAYVYICGSAGSMAKDVRRTWERMAVQILGISEIEAPDYINGLVDQARYNEDVWG
ncbi:cytochrome P450 [Gongronella butleri]|nr:cytochrome P450 [Gongronella butleri]